MIESEWMTTTDPTPMLEFQQGKVSDRKLRLFAVACCRRIDMLLVNGESQSAVHVCEVAADQSVPEQDRQVAYWNSSAPVGEFGWRQDGVLRAAAVAAERCVAMTVRAGIPFHNLLAVMENTAEAERLAQSAGGFTGLILGKLEPTAWQVSLLRCIVGNPFRPVTLDPRWQTETVFALATGIYAERAFDRMPILADALEEAGCDHADILSHCRGDGPHARGCWAVDLVLGKS